MTACTVCMPIARVRAGRARLLRRHCCAAEARHLAARPLATLAGVLALKRAGVELLAAAGAARCRPRDFAFSHTTSGAVTLVKAPRQAGRWHASLSHTRANAYGLMVLTDE